MTAKVLDASLTHAGAELPRHLFNKTPASDRDAVAPTPLAAMIGALHGLLDPISMGIRQLTQLEIQRLGQCLTVDDPIRTGGFVAKVLGRELGL